VVRPRSSLLTLALLLVLAGGCSSKSAAPGSGVADAEQPEAGAAVEAAPERESPNEEAAEPTTASPPAPSRDAKQAEAAPAGERSSKKDDALADSRVEIAERMINGGLDRDIIRRKAQDHEADIRACYERALVGDPTLAGTVVVELEIDARGIVNDMALGAKTDLDDREAVDCIVELLSRWSLAGEVSSAGTVELSFELTPAD
jgi:hypothetical protein